MRVFLKRKVKVAHKSKSLGGAGLVIRFYTAGTETLSGGLAVLPQQRCVVSRES